MSLTEEYESLFAQKWWFWQKRVFDRVGERDMLGNAEAGSHCKQIYLQVLNSEYLSIAHTTSVCVPRRSLLSKTANFGLSFRALYKYQSLSRPQRTACYIGHDMKGFKLFLPEIYCHFWAPATTAEVQYMSAGRDTSVDSMESHSCSVFHSYQEVSHRVLHS